MGSLFDGKYSQWSNRFLPITEVYLKPSQISTMEFFCKIRTDLQILFSVKLSDNSEIVTLLYYHNKSAIQRNELNNRAAQVK